MQMEASVDGNVLTGKVLGDIVDGQRKKELLESIAKEEGISLDQVFLQYSLVISRPWRWAMAPTIFYCCSVPPLELPTTVNQSYKRT
jgi:hypothetical protein